MSEQVIESVAAGYVADFRREFGVEPDMDDESDREHIDAALANLPELRGVTLDAWRGAVKGALGLTADEVQEVIDGLGETGSAWLKVDDLGNGGLYSKREENADARFHGAVSRVADAQAVLDAAFR